MKSSDSEQEHVLQSNLVESGSTPGHEIPKNIDVMVDSWCNMKSLYDHSHLTQNNNALVQTSENRVHTEH